MVRFPANQLEQRFTATAKFNLWPQAKLHTQFPGDGPNKGLRGDPVFDQFYASQVQYIGRNDVSERLLRDAGAALLDKIGPQGTKKKPGPTYGFKSHVWPALAVAVTVADQMDAAP